MPGMNSGLNSDNPALVAAFRSALLHQGILVLAVFGVLALAWAVTREWARPPGARAPGRGAVQAEPSWRHGAADRLRRSVDLRRPAAGPAGHGRRASRAGHQAGRGELPWLGSAPRELGGHKLVVPPGPGGRLGGLDPDRDRYLADHRAARALVPARRAGQRRVGPGGLDVRRGLRRDLRARADVAVRGAGRGAVLLRRRCADRRARAQLAHGGARPGDPVRAGCVLPRHGGAAGLAGPWLLAGTGPQ